MGLVSVPQHLALRRNSRWQGALAVREASSPGNEVVGGWQPFLHSANPGDALPLHGLFEPRLTRLPFSSKDTHSPRWT